MAARALPGITVACLLTLAAPGADAEKTDVVVLNNGDRVTGEVEELAQGRLKYSTDHMGTIYIEWDEITEITSRERFEIEMTTGEDHFGSLFPAGEAGRIGVTGESETLTLERDSIVRIIPIKEGVLSRIDGSIDFGFSFTQAQSATQLTLSTDATYRTRRFEASVELSSIVTDQDEVESTQRSALNFRYLRFRKNRWFGSGILQFQNNEELGLELRTLGGGGVGRYFIQNNRTVFSGGVGLAFSTEEATGLAERQNSFEGLVGLNYSTFAYDFPKTEIKVALQIFPSLSESGRVRFELDAGAKREIVKDFYLSLSVFDSFDSDPPDQEAEKNDFGVITSLGWSF